ncbi:hypothetical protein [Halococcus saccharolyticus]|nr:hypothetical protein [Halococcus saccharolyticus]
MTTDGAGDDSITEECTECGDSVLDIYLEDGVCVDCRGREA